MTICTLVSSTSSAYFLNVVLHTFWHVDVDNTLQIFEIKPHAQSNSSNNNANSTSPKLLQSLNLLFLGQPRMINKTKLPRIPQIMKNLIHIFLSSTINENSLTFSNLFML